MNNITYVAPKVPTLYSVLSVGKDVENPAVYGGVNPHIVKKGQTVEIVVNNHHAAHHPFHLHGHHFQVVSRTKTGSGPYDGSEVGFPAVPMRRDTVIVNGNSSAVLRFKADNPGVWLFHCHVEWHVSMGLSATIIEAPTELQQSLVIPQQHLDVCKAQCMPTKGNAAGNEVDHLDLNGAPTKPEHPDPG
jgi:iron transport multicopper oxidase